MSIVFTAADRLAITRRSLNIVLENQAYQASSNAFTTQQAMLLQVDQSNQKFYDFYNAQVQSYENEARAIDGQVAATYSPSDLTTAAQTPNVAPFYPTTPAPAYALTLPLIQDGSFTNNEVRGRFFPSSTDVLHEQNVISGLSTLITYYLAGSFGTASLPTTTTVPAGVVTGLVLTMASTTGLSNGQMVTITNGSNVGVYTITASTVNVSITVSSVIPSPTAITSGTVSNTSATLQAQILANITYWQTEVSSQVTALGTQNDTRSPYATQNATALTNANSAHTVLAAWLASPSYTSGGLAPIQSLITTRNSYLPTRITQINTALGSSSFTGSNALSQSGSTFSAVDMTNPYYIRYQWLNFRINRATGSLRRYYDATANQGGVQQFLNDNTSIKGQYDSYFLTKALTFNDGSNIIHVTDQTGLNPGDVLTAVSETQPELSTTIVAFMGTTQVQVTVAIPATYTLADKARVFKTL